MITLPPLQIPADADKETLEAYRVQVEQTLTEITDYAERLASR